MLEFTYKEIKIFFIGVLIFTLLYLMIYKKKGVTQNIFGYMNAVRNCLLYAVTMIFFIVGIGIIKLAFIQKIYLALLIPLGWFIIIYFIWKRALNRDFNLNIHILNIEPNNLKKIKETSILSFLAVMFLFVTCMIFFKALPDTENQVYGPIPIFIAGIIFGLITAILCYLTYLKLNVKAKNIKFNTNNIFNIITVFFILFGVLFLSVGIIQTIEYSEKEKTYIETQGSYIGYEKNESVNEDVTYYLLYKYQVEGKDYIVSTNYSTSNIPEYGSEKTILYNPNDPSEAIIKDGASIWLFVFGGVFIIAPFIFKRLSSKTREN